MNMRKEPSTLTPCGRVKLKSISLNKRVNPSINREEENERRANPIGPFANKLFHTMLLVMT